MTSLVGVDPLQSRKKGINGYFGVGDFYCELGIQIVDICISTRVINGGLIDIQDLRSRLVSIRKSENISTDDIERSISQLAPLGGDYKVMTIKDKKVVKSIPNEFNKDHSDLLALLDPNFNPPATFNSLKSFTKWSDCRLQHTLDSLSRDGVLWVDMQAPEPVYYATLFFLKSLSSN
ncbi:Vacuolar-sorting protein SNF8 [Smittium mucronatum]|uniref:Vacuolar-sorting protein SNF8 n=1 Tax=Smittium mucronatum TaxID=133383 RepID=A0A1R0GY11_9FUNG|nr:Vacuolar-sorting protein SNF8 [Smittium mucronatum]